MASTFILSFSAQGEGGAGSKESVHVDGLP